MGATDHMFPDKSAFISNRTVTNLQVHMGNNAFIPVLGRGTAVIALNGKRILVWNALHIPELVVLLYSLCAHLTQRGCGFLGTNNSGMFVYFLQVVLSVDMSSDCNLSYEPMGTGAPLDSLHYVQPSCTPTLYPSLLAASSAIPAPAPINATPALALIKDDSSVKAPPSLPSPDAPKQQSYSNSSPSPALPDTSKHQAHSDPTHVLMMRTPTLLSTMSRKEVLLHMHVPGSAPPAVCPCNTPNGSDIKLWWSSEELHCIMGRRKFRNYKHILEVSGW